MWRVLAGVGAALIMPATLSTITSVFSPDKRAKAVGVWAGVAGAGGMLGLLVAGAMVEQWWWGSIFVTTASLAAVALVATLVIVPETRAAHTVRLDPGGALFSIVAVGGIVLGIIEGPSRGWTDPITLFGIVGGVLAGVLFVRWELRRYAPMLDPRLFGLRGFATGSTSLFLQFFALFGFFFIALQYLQLVLGYSTLTSAVALVPAVVVMMPLSTVAMLPHDVPGFCGSSRPMCQAGRPGGAPTARRSWPKSTSALAMPCSPAIRAPTSSMPSRPRASIAGRRARAAGPGATTCASSERRTTRSEAGSVHAGAAIRLACMRPRPSGIWI